MIAASLLAMASPSVAADIELISQGRRVDIEDHVVPGKLVLFDFFADWCAPCRILEPQIKRLAERFPEQLAVRQVDVINWDSPVAQQYRIASLPFLALYGPDGLKLAEGDVQQVFTVLEQHLDISGAVGTGGGGLRVPGIVWVIALAALVVGSFVVSRRTAIVQQRDGSAAPGTPRTRDESAAEGASPRIWLAMVQGSLEGPYSREQLDGLVKRKKLGMDDRIRRRGDAAWRRLADVIDAQ
jgi:thiol-disulfide isomerase/thioredoxin